MEASEVVPEETEFKADLSDHPHVSEAAGLHPDVGPHPDVDLRLDVGRHQDEGRPGDHPDVLGLHRHVGGRLRGLRVHAGLLRDVVVGTQVPVLLHPLLVKNGFCFPLLGLV